MAVGLSVELRKYSNISALFIYLLRGGGCAGRHEGRERLGQDVAADVLGAAKNGSAKVLIVKVFMLPIVKARAGHAVSFPRLLTALRAGSPFSWGVASGGQPGGRPPAGYTPAKWGTRPEGGQ